MHGQKTSRIGVFLGVLSLCGTAACTGMGASNPPGGAATVSDRNLLTEEDLAGMEDLNAYQAIRRLKPLWLRYRGQSVLEGPEREGLRIYTDGTFFGDAETLSQIPVRNVMEIRYLDARQATLRFGTDHSVGALLIKTRR
jgi:hypothetical protein